MQTMYSNCEIYGKLQVKTRETIVDLLFEASVRFNSFFLCCSHTHTHGLKVFPFETRSPIFDFSLQNKHVSFCKDQCSQCTRTFNGSKEKKTCSINLGYNGCYCTERYKYVLLFAWRALAELLTHLFAAFVRVENGQIDCLRVCVSACTSETATSINPICQPRCKHSLNIAFRRIAAALHSIGSTSISTETMQISRSDNQSITMSGRGISQNIHSHCDRLIRLLFFFLQFYFWQYFCAISDDRWHICNM